MISFFPLTPPQTPLLFHPSSLPFASTRVLLHPLTHSFLTAGLSCLHSTKALPSHWCQILPYSNIYASRARLPPCILFGWWFIRWELWVLQLVDIVLPKWLQFISAPSILPSIMVQNSSIVYPDLISYRCPHTENAIPTTTENSAE